MVVLVLSSRRSPRRDAALRLALGGDGAEMRFVAIDCGVTGVPGLGEADAVVIDGLPCAPGPSVVADLRHRVEAGMFLLVLGAAPVGPGNGIDTDGAAPWFSLLGVVGRSPTPQAELVATVVDPTHALTRRCPSSFVVVDRLTPLEAWSDWMRPVLTVNVAYHDLPAVLAGPLGAGQVAVVGLGNLDTALAQTELARILARAVRPGPEPSAGERTLGLAVVGYGSYGGMGQLHRLAATSVDGLEMVAAVDNRAERRKAAEQDFPGARAYTSVDELALDEDVDVAVVATPPSSHARLALQLLRAGKHVVCEKPMCLTVAEADDLVATAADQGRVLTVNQNRRWDPDFLATRRAVDAGLLGQLFNMETFVGGFEHPCRDWHSEVSVSGGAVYDWGSHHIDWILQLMGSVPGQVRTTGHKRVWHNVTNLDQLRVHLEWDDGREAEFVQSDVAAVRRPKFYLQGAEGTLVGHYRPLTFESVEPVRGYARTTPHHAEAPAELILAR
ncbi:MAG: Gfo/Idh/MocA family protein [Acidimicrobiales bacterium]